jgi:hypothetical protein
MRLAAKEAAAQAQHPQSDAKESKDDWKNDAKNSETWVNGSSVEEKAQSKYPTASGNVSTAGAKAQFKPAWAMTEKAAEDQMDQINMEEEDDLIEFAKSLDFDKYMGDVEVQTVMEKLRRRIDELERDVAQEDLRSADAETRAAMRLKLEKLV